MPRLEINLQLFNEEVETPVETVEQVEEKPTPGFLDEFEYQFDKASQKVNSVDELKELAEMGRFYKERGKEKLSTLEAELEKTKNAPELKFLNDFLQKNGYESFEEYQEALAIDEIKKENEALTDEMAKELLYGRRAKEREQEQQRSQEKAKEQEAKKQAEYMDFFNKYPDVNPHDIDAEVFELAQNVPLSIAYELVNLRKGNDKTKIEQDVIRKLQENSAQSVGSVTKGNPTHTNSVKDMSKSDFKAKVDAVLRGETKEL